MAFTTIFNDASYSTSSNLPIICVVSCQQKIEIEFDEIGIGGIEERKKIIENVLIVHVVIQRVQILHQSKHAQFVFI